MEGGGGVKCRLNHTEGRNRAGEGGGRKGLSHRTDSHILTSGDGFC